ncbi:DNA polymerase V subunit UmuC [Enterobacterales bacterium CwR94]|nr:DNA polymerase V subunit UmuC [Enterobacterales bacterium CwR94]
MSQRVMTLLEMMSPTLEIYSIDEAFLAFSDTGKYVSLLAFGEAVKERVKQDTGLTVGVGIAPTKTLAKLANYAAKTWPATGGVVDLSCPLRQRKLLARVPVAEVWGVGRRIAKRLAVMGIETALDLANASPATIRKTFNVVLERTVRELRGESCLTLEEVSSKQNILCSRSFGSRISEYAEMRQAVCAYAERAGAKLRKEKQFCRQVSTFIRTSPHAEGEVFYANQATAQLPFPSNDTRDIVRLAIACLDTIWIPGHRYMKAGIMLGDFFSEGVAQFNLFDTLQPQRNSQQLMAVMDKINQSGRHTLWFAGQGIRQTWQMKRDMLSPAYTTRVADLPIAHAN